jgi:hypothetical protein
MPADRAIPRTAAAAAPASQVECPKAGGGTILVAAFLPGRAAAPGSSAVSRPAWLIALRTIGAAAGRRAGATGAGRSWFEAFRNITASSTTRGVTRLNPWAAPTVKARSRIRLMRPGRACP